MQPVAGEDTVGGAFMFDLGHHPLVGLVAQVKTLGDQPIQPGTLELIEPSAGDVLVLGRRRDIHRCSGAGERLLQRRASVRERFLGEVVVTQGEQVEGDKARRGLSGQQRDPAGWQGGCAAAAPRSPACCAPCRR